MTHANVADYLTEHAEAQPDATAIYFPGKGERYTELTYKSLNDRADAVALGLHACGIEPGTLAALMVKPSPDLMALVFGMMKGGVAPVMIDPGLGIKNIKACLERTRASAFIGITAAHAARIALGWPKFEHKVTVGRRLLWGGVTLEALEAKGREALARGESPPAVDPDDVSAITFTSGSTGSPKGVVYRHRMMSAQVEALRELFDIQPGEIDLPTFPLFALFDPALGMTTVIPDMDFTKPAEVQPENILGPIERFKITMMFGSPALLNTVGRHGEKLGTKLPSLKRVVAAGAPLPADTARRWLDMLPDDGNIYPPYGCSEALPIACIDGRTILGETWAETERGAGVCVGMPVASIEVDVIKITDEVIESYVADELRVPMGEVGEICLRGPMVTESYLNEDDKTALAKMSDGNEIWHRVGDLGWLDEQGRLWFCGRKSHRVVLEDTTLFTVPCEKVFDAHPLVFRTALVGPMVDGRVVPTLCVEMEAGADWAQVERELTAIRDEGAHWHADIGRVEAFLVHDGFPVDIRHNAKISREQLREWAAPRLARSKAA